MKNTGPRHYRVCSGDLPFGLNLFVSSRITGKPLMTIARGVVPFLAIMLVCLLVITFVPWISLILPDLLLR